MENKVGENLNLPVHGCAGIYLDFRLVEQYPRSPACIEVEYPRWSDRQPIEMELKANALWNLGRRQPCTAPIQLGVDFVVGPFVEVCLYPSFRRNRAQKATSEPLTLKKCLMNSGFSARPTLLAGRIDSLFWRVIGKRECISTGEDNHLGDYYGILSFLIIVLLSKLESY